LLASVSEEREALQRPTEESEWRIAAMKQTLVEAERSMLELGFLLMAEQHRLSDLFVNRHKAFLASVSPEANRSTRPTSRVDGKMRELQRSRKPCAPCWRVAGFKPKPLGVFIATESEQDQLSKSTLQHQT
jgi:hypothetical protein